MATSPILGITQVASNQNQPELTINSAINALEAASNATLSPAFTSNACVLTAAQFTGYVRFVATGLTAAGTLTVPLSLRLFIVDNTANSFALTVGGASGATVGLPAGGTAVLFCDGTKVVLVASTTGGSESGGGSGSLPTIAAGELLANIGTTAAAAGGVTLSALLDDVLGGTQGAIVYRGASGWVELAPGTSGQVLQTGGTAENPSWATVSESGGGGGGGTITVGPGLLLGNYGTASAAAEGITIGANLTLSPTGTLSASGGSGGSTTGGHRYWRIYIESTVYGSYAGIVELTMASSTGGANLCTTGANASASSSFSGYPASAAIDNNTSTYWGTASGVSAPWWWEYDFGSGNTENIVEVTITAREDAPTTAPGSWALQYSDDNSTWSTADTFISATWTAGAVQTFSVPQASSGSSSGEWQAGTVTALGVGLAIDNVVGPVQSGFARANGTMTVTLAEAPTPGNLLVAILAGYGGGTLPTGFTQVESYTGPWQGIVIGTRTVVSGDGVTWSGSNTQPCSFGLFEFPAGSTISCAQATPTTSGDVISYPTALSDAAGFSIGVFEFDSTNAYASLTGATLLYDGSGGGMNHPAVFWAPNSSTAETVAVTFGSSSFDYAIAALVSVTEPVNLQLTPNWQGPSVWALAANLVANAGTLEVAAAAHSLVGNPGTAAGVAQNITIGANLTLSPSGVLSSAGGGGGGSGGGVVITNGTVTLSSGSLDIGSGLSLTAGVASAFLAAQVALGAVHQYALGDSTSVATDTGSSPANGTYGGTYSQVTALAAGAAYSTYLNDGYMNCPFDNPPTGTNGAFSIELLFKGTGSLNRIIANDHTDNQFRGFQIENASMDVAFTGGNANINFSPGFVDNTLCHLVVTFDGTTLKAYINNTLQGSATPSGTYVPGQYPVTLGYNPAYQGDWSIGDYQGFALYNFALSAAQVAANYATVTETVTTGGALSASGGGSVSLGSLFVPETIARPAVTGFSWLNQGSSSLTDNANGPLTVSMQPNPSAALIRAITQAIPGTTPWTLTARLNLTSPNAEQYTAVGICVIDNAGKLAELCFATVTGASPAPGVYMTYAPSATGSNLVQKQVSAISGPEFFLRIYHDGNYLHFQVSQNGAVWTEICSSGATSYLGTITEGGICAQCIDASGVALPIVFDVLGFELVAGTGTNTTWLSGSGGSGGGSSSSNIRTLAFPIVGVPAGGQQFNLTVTQAGTLLANGGTPQAFIGTDPTATETLILNTIHSGTVTTRGTVTISTAGVVTWPSFSAVAFAAGDTAQLVNEGTADATFGNACLSLQYQVT